MKKSRLFSRFGLVIDDLDLREVDDAVLNELLDDLEEHSLLLFRRQLLDDRDLEAFSRRVGELEEPARKICHSPGSSYVGYLTNLRDEQGEPLGFPGNHTDYWHSDQEYRKNPATLATLYCLLPCPVGGDTSFASTLITNMGLSPSVVRELEGLRVTYLAASTHDNVERVEVAHPLLLTSPRSGKQSAYVSENTRRVVGKSNNLDQELPKRLLGSILRPDNIYAHRWSMGDFIIYDNAQLLHRRESFEGLRWLKATKIFAPKDRFAVPVGELC